MHSKVAGLRHRFLVLAAVVLVATVGGGLLAIWSYTAERRLSAGSISLSVSPFHDGALDVYVPLVDWGVRFDGVGAPARLKVELQAVDRDEATAIASGGLDATRAVRGEARDAVASYLRLMALLAAAGALATGLLVLAALRPRRRRRLPLVGVVLLGAGGWGAAVAFLLAPRGALSSPQYYANGADIPAALRAVEAATRSGGVLGEELDSQLLGLARLVTAPGDRDTLNARLPRLTVASDLHNNVVAIPVIKQAAAGGPVVLAGDLTDRGTPLETRLLRSVAQAGRPVVFVGGNHDSDASSRALARAGAIVLTRSGRLFPNGRHGRLITRVGGVRMAGYESPNLRRAADGYDDRGATISLPEQAAFRLWLQPLLGRVDVVVVHEPLLAALAVSWLRTAPPATPLLVIDGHTHRQAVESRDGVTVVNGGTAGGGGTGNLADNQPIGLAVVTYRRRPFSPLAVDLVQVAPGTGGGTARRVRLDEGDAKSGDVEARSPEETETETTTGTTTPSTGTTPAVP